jgi:glycosyltransferase 2 family protein
MNHPFVKRFIWVMIGVILLYTFFIVWSGVSENVRILRQFPWQQMPLILGAVIMNFIIRELKWDYFRRAAGIKVPRFGSFLVFFSGFSMSISPARAGELIKPFMYKEYFDQKMRRTVPLVFCERISDVLGMIVLAALTIAAYMHGVGERLGSARGYVGFIYAFLVFSCLSMLFLLWFMRQKRLVYRVLLALSRKKRLYKPLHKLRKLYYSTYPLLTMRNLFATTAIAAFSWFWECIAIMLIIHGCGAENVTLAQSTFIFCMATIFGGFLFFLPGGIGGFEGSCLAMLGMLGVANETSVSSVFIIRFSTLFFAVALGFLFILLTSAKYHKRMMWEEFEHAEEVVEAEVEPDLPPAPSA